MEDAFLNNLAIGKILKQIHIYPDILIEIQSHTDFFDENLWNAKTQVLHRELPVKKFLYLFIKCDESNIYAFYFGKSEKKKYERINQHIQGLKKASLITQQEGDSSFYNRMYKRFFSLNSNIPLYLLIFKWDKNRIIKNLFPFPVDCNISNAEFLLTTYINSKYPFSNINHDFITRIRWKNLNLEQLEISQNELISINGNTAAQFWKNFMENWMLTEKLTPLEVNINRIIHIPLFKTKQNSKEIETFVKNDLIILQTSDEMKKNIQDSVKIVEESYEKFIEKKKRNNKILFSDGLVYMVYLHAKDLEPDFPNPTNLDIIPVYIGKTEAVGRTGVFSRNLKGVSRGINLIYFARWGYDPARHIGGLSLQFFNIPNRYRSTDYEHWIQWFFDADKRKKKVPYLKYPVYFRMKPCFPYNISLNGKLGLFSPEIEGILITIARILFPEILSNKNGR